MEIKLIESFDDSQALAELEKIEKQLASVAEEGENAGKSVSTAFAETEAAAESLNKTLDTNAKAVAEQGKAVEASRRNMSEWRKALNDGINGVQVFGKSIGEWREQLSRLDILTTKSAESTGKLTVAQRLLNLVLKASPIGLIITAVAGLLSYFTRFQTGIDTVSAAFSGLNGVVNKVLERLALVGSAITNFATGNFTAGVNDLKDSVDNLGGALADAAVEAFTLERRLQALRDAQIAASVAFARQEVQLDKLKQQAQDETLSYRERIEAIKQGGEIETRIAGQRLEFARENLDIIQTQLQVEQRRLEELVRGGAEEAEIRAQRVRAEREAANTTIDDRKRLAEAEIAVIDAQAESSKTRVEFEKELREVQKKAREDRKRALEEERAELERLAADLAKLRVAAEPEGIDRDLAEVNKKYDALIGTAQRGVDTLRKIERRRELTPEEAAQLQELADLQVQIEAQRLQALLEVLVEYNEKETEAEEEQQKRREALAQRTYEQQVQDLEARRDLAAQALDLAEVQAEGAIARLRASGATEAKIAEAKEALDLEIQARRLQNLIDFQQQLLKLETDPARIQAIIAEIKILQGELANLDIDTPDGRKPRSLLQLLGIEDENVEQGIKTAVAQVQRALDEIAAARVRDAEQARELAEQRVQDAEAAFEKEQERAEQGLSNNVELAERQLDQERAAREKALKEEARAKRAQVLLQSVEQVSSLITASANIFASLSAIPFVGVPLAIGLIATMFGAFAASKARALQSVSEVPKLRKGAKLQGLSHEAGGTPVHVRGFGMVEAERDEWLIGTEHSREHDGFLNRLNNGEFHGVDLNSIMGRRRAGAGALADLETPIGASAARVVVIQADAVKAEAANRFEAMQRAYEGGAREIVEAIQRRPIIKPWKTGYIQEKTEGNVHTRSVVLPAEE